MAKGIVYVLTNPAMDGYVKIGKTQNISKRLKDLDKTNLPLPFECIYAVEVDDYDHVEKLAHNAFSNVRSRSKREFFKVDEQQVISALMISGGREVTPDKDTTEDKEPIDALNEKSNRRPKFDFFRVGLKENDVITYIRMPNITATVCSETTILFEGEETSIYQATMTLLKRQGIHWKSVQGQQYWDYDGETLSHRRRRIEGDLVTI